MDRASHIAQEAVSYAKRHLVGHERATPMDYEAAFAEKLRKYFPQTKRVPRKKIPK
jgi:hypothetical protein